MLAKTTAMPVRDCTELSVVSASLHQRATLLLNSLRLLTLECLGAARRSRLPVCRPHSESDLDEPFFRNFSCYSTTATADSETAYYVPTIPAVEYLRY